MKHSIIAGFYLPPAVSTIMATSSAFTVGGGLFRIRLFTFTLWMPLAISGTATSGSLNFALKSDMIFSGTGGDVSSCLSIASRVIFSKSDAVMRSARGRVSSIVKLRAILLYCIPAILCPSARFANEKKVPMVLITPVNSDTPPIPREAIVGSENIDDDEPERKPTRVLRTIVGRATIVLRMEKYASAFVCIQDKPAHRSASSAISSSSAVL